MECDYGWRKAYRYINGTGRFIEIIDNTTVPDAYIAQAAVLSVVFPLSFVGMVLNIVFIYRKKTNFLVRRIVYMTVIPTLKLGAFFVWTISALIEEDADESRYSAFCIQGRALFISAATGSQWMMAILMSSIYFTLVTQLCGCFSRRCPWSSWCEQSCFQNYCMDVLLLMITLLVGFVCSVTAYSTDHYQGKTSPIPEQVLITMPLAIVALSLLGNFILSIWFCTLWRRQFTRRRDILKEIGVFFILLFITIYLCFR